ncbi:hypothetical protein [Mesorhizobium sp. ORS 3428]|uniref:hypothetical protein n=1 Tax=Mesorhizobium sp. ORS 3428 TaxID=540997 RepID=UPI00191BCC56|nr:hypothetical protein [Mesorhizobium sp. ORS 3428]
MALRGNSVKPKMRFGRLKPAIFRRIDNDIEDAAAKLRELGGAKAIMSTIGAGKAVSGLLPGLAPVGV